MLLRVYVILYIYGEKTFFPISPVSGAPGRDSLKAGKFVQFAPWPVFDILIQKGFTGRVVCTKLIFHNIACLIYFKHFSF